MISPTDPRSSQVASYFSDKNSTVSDGKAGGKLSSAALPLLERPLPERPLPERPSVALSSTLLAQQQKSSPSIQPLSNDTTEGADVKRNAASRHANRDASGMLQSNTMSSAVANANIDFSQGNALDLVFKAALDGINQALAPMMGEDAIQAGYASGLDVSPEATADRIVSLSTGLFSSFKEQNPELTDDESRARFSDIISEGVDTGFSEARTILEGLGVLEGSIAENIDKTYALVFEGIEAFREGGNRPEQTASEPSDEGDTVKAETSSASPSERIQPYSEITQDKRPPGMVNLSA